VEAVILAWLAACTLDAVPGGDCTRLPEGRDREDCHYASARAARRDPAALRAVLGGVPDLQHDAILVRLAADEPEAAAVACGLLRVPAPCGNGGSVVPRTP
jgi:hypothetical protein